MYGNAEILEAAVDMIAPPADQRDHCRRQILYYAKIGPGLIAARNLATAGELRDEISHYRDAIIRFRYATRALSRRASVMVLSDQSVMPKGGADPITANPDVGGSQVLYNLEKMIERIDRLVKRGGIRIQSTGNKRHDPVIVAAANWALRLMTKFSAQEPTTSIEGVYFNLTRLLANYLTGQEKHSVDRVCKVELKKFRDEQASK